MPRPAARRRVGRPANTSRRTSGVFGIDKATPTSSVPKSDFPPNKESRKTRHVDENEAESSQTIAKRPRGIKHVSKDSTQKDQTAQTTRHDSNHGNEVSKDSFPYPALEVRQRKINVDVIDDTWQLMADTSQAEVVTILNRSVRNIIQTGKSERARIEMQTMLNQLVAKCEKSFKKVQIPPRTKDKYFDYEWLINENTRLSDQLNSEKRQISQLKADIYREDRQAEKNDKLLHTLKANAETEEKLRRKKIQSLLPAFKRNPKAEDEENPLSDKIHLINEPLLETAALYDVSMDEDLLSLTRKLERHLDSLQENRDILRDVPECMQAARAAVDDYLFHTSGYEALAGV